MTTPEHSDLFAPMGDDVMHGIDQYIEAQTRFLETWEEAIHASSDDDVVTAGAEGLIEAYTIWLEASREWTEQLTAAAEGDSIDPRAVRDIWLRAANKSAKALMSTTAFARMTGQSVQDGLEWQRQQDEAIQAMVESMGVATSHTVEEVGERLVELERRQHAVEEKLDRLLDEHERA